MPNPLDSVTAQAMKLSAAERAELIERLADTLLPAPPLHPSWDAEITRRLAALDAGTVEPVAAETVFAKARSVIDASSRRP